MALALPALVLLKSKSNGKHLHAIVDDKQPYGSLQFSGKNVFGPEAKYAVEFTSDGLVHIRCCYNNKYWVRRSEDDHRIVAQATEPEEERSKWSCTLFKPILVDDQTVRFLHIQLNGYVSVNTTSDCTLWAAPTMQGRGDQEKEAEFAFINWESLLILPKYAVFKGDNGCYLRVSQVEDRLHMQFASRDKGDPTAMNEVEVADGGCVRIKCGHGKFWRRDPNTNCICADSEDGDPSGNDDLFWAVKIKNEEIALRNQGNSSFCRRLTEGKTDCLSADVDGITKEARLEVEEPVVSRSITDVKFRPADRRIRNRNVVTLASDEITNKSRTESQTEVLMFSYPTTESSTWSSAVSLKLEIETTIKAGIPSMLDGQIEISSEDSRPIKWGKTEQRSILIERKRKVTIPPMTTVKVSLLATKGSFEVPFSYTQLDTLTNGVQVTTNYDDGVYIGESFFEFRHETEQNPL